jgi:hypothetical protein
MAGTHLISGSLIQSGSTAQFKSGINVDKTLIVNGPVKSNNIIGLSSNRSATATIPTLNVGKANDDGTFEEWVTSKDTEIRITASGNFNNFTFIENQDLSVGGGGIIQPLNLTHENLNNFVMNEAATIQQEVSGLGIGISSITDGDIDTGYQNSLVLGGSYTIQNLSDNPHIFTQNFNEPTIISKYKIFNYGPPDDYYGYVNWTFQGSNDNFISFNSLHTQINYGGEGGTPEYNSFDIENNTPYSSYRFVFTSKTYYVVIQQIQLFKKEVTTSNNSIWKTLEKGNFNGQSSKSFITKTYDAPGIYEYLIFANNTSTLQTAIVGTTVTVTA